DFGICAELLRHASLPILGVCLGHQGVASVFGGTVQLARTPMHGRLSPVHHTPSPTSPSSCHSDTSLFEGLPNPFSAVRYHSLVVRPADLPSCLRVTAWTKDPAEDDQGGEYVIQGLEHRERPIWGVQFHPESICTEGGTRLIANFFALAARFCDTTEGSARRGPVPDDIMQLGVVPGPLLRESPKGFRKETLIHAKRLSGTWVDPKTLFEHIYKDDQISFWLDSAKVEKSLSRFSYMGSMSTACSFALDYHVASRTITTTKLAASDSKLQRPYISTAPPIHHVLPPSETFFSYVAQTMQAHGLRNSRVVMHDDELDALPFPFTGGLVGFFGYEMKEERLGAIKATEHLAKSSITSTPPDASFVLGDRVVVFDHIDKEMWLLAVEYGDDDAKADAAEWIRNRGVEILAMQVNGVRQKKYLPVHLNNTAFPPTVALPPLRLRDPQASYLAKVRESLRNITNGETYEVCLTTQITQSLPPHPAPRPDPLSLYIDIRARNPAPYGAFLRFGPSFAIASSSPERFMRVEERGEVTMKPIKGTVRRAEWEEGMTERDLELEDERRCRDLQADEKNRAENLMIVDLIRNDLNTICTPLSVHVPSLFHIESYKTVHQLVTTVRGTLRSNLTPVDALVHAFPPGSMTGAPKTRTVRILEDLEVGRRGPYSGVLGYFSLGGAAEFSVVIRTAVCYENEVSVGAGGAIVALSDPEEEFDEMILKANSVLPSIMHVYGAGPLDLEGIR
ncbi:hypothetical protein HKX48_005433, partial [Thoreauomyces humboldtii]